LPAPSMPSKLMKRPVVIVFVLRNGGMSRGGCLRMLHCG
jgi:hypothetical protein